MQLRTGRRNPLVLYVQLGDEPGDDDPCLGLVRDAHAAAILCRLVNERPATERSYVHDALMGAMAEQLIAP